VRHWQYLPTKDILSKYACNSFLLIKNCRQYRQHKKCYHIYIAHHKRQYGAKQPLFLQAQKKMALTTLLKIKKQILHIFVHLLQITQAAPVANVIFLSQTGAPQGF
jgi:hypothetical protein